MNALTSLLLGFLLWLPMLHAVAAERMSDAGVAAAPSPILVRQMNLLVMACSARNLGAVQQMLDAYPQLSLNQRGPYWKDSPLNVASARGVPALVSLLLSRGADPNFRGALDELPLESAASYGNVRVVELLLAYGATVDGETPPFMTTALIRAARYGQVGVVKVLLKAGADVNKKSRGGVTALLMATEHHHKEVVRILLAAGAKVCDRTGSCQ